MSVCLAWVFLTHKWHAHVLLSDTVVLASSLWNKLIVSFIPFVFSIVFFLVCVYLNSYVLDQ